MVRFFFNKSQRKPQDCFLDFIPSIGDSIFHEKLSKNKTFLVTARRINYSKDSETIIINLYLETLITGE